jgi:putative hemolysin
MEILIIFLLILLNGIFSMSEIALVSSNKFKLDSASKKGNKNAGKALALASNPNTFLSTVQIGITLIGILTGIYSGQQITEDVLTVIDKISFLSKYSETISVAVVLIVLTFFSLVFGELLPKRIGLAFPETIASLVAQPMGIISTITKPFVWLLGKTNDLLLKIFGIKPKQDEIVSEEEIKSIIQNSAESGEIQEIEQNIVSRVFALGDRKIIELMTHRNDLISIDVKDNLDTIKLKAGTEPHSVYPVINNSFDNTLGIISVKDIFPKDFSSVEFDLKPFMKQPIMVHGNSPAYKVLEKFREQKLHYAFVVDEYGAVEGMVSMDDILDALLGDVTEYNQHEFKIVKRENTTWMADGQYPFFEFINYFNLTLEDTGDYNTLAGFILDKFNHIPSVGEKVGWHDFEFEIIDMDGRRIDKVLISRQSHFNEVV